MWRWMVLGLTAALLGGCNSFTFVSSSNKAINGNNSGGIVPATVTDENEQTRDAQAHCAKYNKILRITARPQDAGGKMVFVCEAPGTPPPPPGAPSPNTPNWVTPQSSDPGDLPGVRMKKQ